MNRIQEVLKDQGRSQIWLADKLGKSYNMVNSYVKNRRQPSLDILYQIADILSVDAKDLLVSSVAKEEKQESTAETKKIPLLGDISCGIPILAAENVRAEIPVAKQLLQSNQNYFILRAQGTSMDEAGIQDGDLVLIRQQQSAENKDLVVALIDDEATIKEFHHNGDMIVLKPKSSDVNHQPIILTENFKIQGVVEKVINI